MAWRNRSRLGDEVNGFLAFPPQRAAVLSNGKTEDSTVDDLQAIAASIDRVDTSVGALAWRYTDEARQKGIALEGVVYVRSRGTVGHGGKAEVCGNQTTVTRQQ